MQVNQRSQFLTVYQYIAQALFAGLVHSKNLASYIVAIEAKGRM